MTHFNLESWDKGRLVVNHAFANLLRRHHWTTFATVWARTSEAAVAKKLRTDRMTLRFALDDAGRDRTFYIKRHGRSAWKEYVKPLLSLRWPILGAKNEWTALLDFHAAGLPTMTPVACGQHGANSFLITEALEDCTKLSELGRGVQDEGRGTKRANGNAHHAAIGAEYAGLSTQDSGLNAPFARRTLIEEVARLTKRMHGAGLHHQDFYLGHLLLPNHRTADRSGDDRIFIIDLGRVRKQNPLASRWIVKDLAQLNHSAQGVASSTDRLRFLREYLGREIGPADRRLIARIAAKTSRISRHSKKNSL